MDKKKSSPACPWGAPLSSVQWGSPVPGPRADSRPDSPQTSSPAERGPNTSNTLHPADRSGDAYRTPNANSFRHQRSSPYQQRPHGNRMRLPSLVDGGASFSSPRNFQPRQRFQGSPRFGTPSGQYQPQFMNSPGNNFRPRSDFSPSPRHGFSSGKKSFSPRHDLGSSSTFDPSQFVHPSMLDDPWKALPALPLLQQY